VFATDEFLADGAFGGDKARWIYSSAIRTRMILRIVGIIDLIVKIPVPLVDAFVPVRRHLLKGKVGYHSTPSSQVSIILMLYSNV
jgi:hypothetical protein